MAGKNVFRHLNDLPESHGTVASQSSSDSNNGNNKNNQNRRVGNYVRKKPTKILSMIHIAVGVTNFLIGLALFIVGNGVEWSLYIYGDYGMSAVITGAFIVANGTIGYFSSKNSRNGFLNRFNMAMSITTCICAVTNVTVFSIATLSLVGCVTYYHPFQEDAVGPVCLKKNVGIVMTSSLLVINVIEFGVALASSIYSCLFYDCCVECCQGEIKEPDDERYIYAPEHPREETNIRQHYTNYGSYQDANSFIGQNSNENEKDEKTTRSNSFVGQNSNRNGNGSEQSRDTEENSAHSETEDRIAEEYVVIVK